MLTFVRKHLTPPMLVALLALLVALSGTSYAAVALARNSVGSPQIKPGAVKKSDLGTNAVTGQKVRDRSIGDADLKPGVTAVQRPLASGQTMRGWFAAGGGADSASADYLGEGITFPQRLPANFNLTNVEYIPAGAPVTANCPGVYSAAPGWACFYEAQRFMATLCCIYDKDFSNPAVDYYGTRMYWNQTGNGAYADGSWAITAP